MSAADVERFEPSGEPAAPLARAELTRRLVAAGLELGFAKLGVTSAEPLGDGRDRLEAFRARGHAAGMDYLERGARHDPRALLAGAESAVVVALAYGDPALVPLRTERGLAGGVARYARGQDYHLVIKDKLRGLAQRLADLAGRPIAARVCVDTAPLLERALAERAGLGFAGKSTLLIAPGLGSFVLLGELLCDVPLEPSEAGGGAGCGACRACLDACPTSAFTGPHELDARRCVSFLTIEHEGAIPVDLRRGVGTRVFGCDVCQDVCPFNASPRPRPLAPELAGQARFSTVDWIALLNLGSAAYRKLVKRSALRRASRATLQRNAAIALGNSGDRRAVAPLAAAVREHASALVRAHAAWALGELGRVLGPDEASRAALEAAAERDPDGATRAEASAALPPHAAALRRPAE